MDTLTQRIISLRELKNISKAEMSRILDLDPSNYNKYEKIGRDWTINQIEKIAGALGVTVVELLTGEEKPTQNDERVSELEKRVSELEDRIKDKETLLDIYKSDLTKHKEFLVGHFRYYVFEELRKVGFDAGSDFTEVYNFYDRNEFYPIFKETVNKNLILRHAFYFNLIEDYGIKSLADKYIRETFNDDENSQHKH